MKKFTSLIISLVMICSLSFAALATDSPDGVVDISGAKDSNGSAIEYTTDDTTVPLCTPEICSRLTNVPADQLKLLWQKDISSDTLPATFTFTCGGTDNKTVYVLHYNGSDWELITSGTGPSVTATFPDLSPVAVFVRDGVTPDGGSNGSTSPKTADNNIVPCLIVIAVIASAAAVTIKIKAKKAND